MKIHDAQMHFLPGDECRELPAALAQTLPDRMPETARLNSTRLF